mgnify:CR=1 FL=1
MKITYLFQSGIAIEFVDFVIFIDIITPPTIAPAGRRTYILASHAHQDHYAKALLTSRIFQQATFILSDDIDDLFEAEHILSVSEGNEYELADFKLKTFGSTDRGVSFYIRTAETTFFHSGDLNWWHWENSDQESQLQEEKDYKMHLEQLKDWPVDIAFVPADPRLGYAYDYAVKYFIETIAPKVLIPMHFWDDFLTSERLKKELHPAKTEICLVPNRNTLIYQA